MPAALLRHLSLDHKFLNIINGCPALQEAGHLLFLSLTCLAMCSCVCTGSLGRCVFPLCQPGHRPEKPLHLPAGVEGGKTGTDGAGIKCPSCAVRQWGAMKAGAHGNSLFCQELCSLFAVQALNMKGQHSGLVAATVICVCPYSRHNGQSPCCMGGKAALPH